MEENIMATKSNIKWNQETETVNKTAAVINRIRWYSSSQSGNKPSSKKQRASQAGCWSKNYQPKLLSLKNRAKEKHR